jgi:hypothetical protein
MISSATEKDWEDFWKSEDIVNSYSEYVNDEDLLINSEENVKILTNFEKLC